LEVLLEEVSFQEAINALKDGLSIHWFSRDTNKIIHYKPNSYYKTLNLTPEQINEGNWAIESRYH